jgi:hypothetical protein
MSSRACICSVISRSYVPFAQVLVDSIRRFHSEAELDVLICVIDGDASEAPAGSIGVDAAEVLGEPGMFDMAWRYGRRQLVIGAKALMLQAALRRGYERAAFLDVDMLVLAPLDPILDLDAAQILLTPHVLEPSAAERVTSGDTGLELERVLLLSGVYNGGCISIGAGEHSARMLEWLADRLRVACRHDVANGLHNDQTWLDFVPGMFDDVQILRDPTINVAYWNLHQRQLTLVAGEWMLEQGPLRLFHFSGVDPRQPQFPTVYRPALDMAAMGTVAPLFEHYVELLVAAGIHDTIDRPNGLGNLADGTVLDDDLRARALASGVDLTQLDPRDAMLDEVLGVRELAAAPS